MANIVERPIVPHNPSPTKAVQKEQYNLFAPVATNGKVGMSKYNKTQFDIKEQEVSLSKDYLDNSLLQVVDLKKSLPEGIEYAVDGIKTPNVAYLNFSHEVVTGIKFDPTELDQNKLKVKGSVTGALLVIKRESPHAQIQYFLDEILVSNVNIYIRNLRIDTDGDVGSVSDFLPLKDYYRIQTLYEYLNKRTQDVKSDLEETIADKEQTLNQSISDVRSDFAVALTEERTLNATTYMTKEHENTLDGKYVHKDSDGNVRIDGNLDIVGEVNRVNTNVLEADSPLSIVNSAVLDGEAEAIWTNAGNIIILSHLSGDEYDSFGFVYNKYNEKAMIVRGVYNKSTNKFSANNSVFVPSWNGAYEENAISIFDGDGNIKPSSVKVKDNGTLSVPSPTEDDEPVDYKTFKDLEIPVVPVDVISNNTKRIAVVEEKFSKAEEQFSKVEEQLTIQDIRLTNIEARFSDDAVIDNTVAYRKIVPANALPYAEVQKVGGMTHKIEPKLYPVLTDVDYGNGIVVDADGNFTVTNTQETSHEFFMDIYYNDFCDSDKYFTLHRENTSVIDAHVELIFVKQNEETGEYDVNEAAYPLNSWIPKYNLNDYMQVDSDIVFTIAANAGTVTFKPVLAETEDIEPKLLDTKVTELVSEGANLFDISKALSAACVDNGDGSYTLTNNGDSRFSGRVPVNIPANTTFTISGTIIDRGAAATDLNIQIKLVDGSYVGLYPGSSFSPTTATYAVAVESIAFYVATSDVGHYFTFKEVMVNLGTTAAPYKPYRADAVDTFPISAELRAFLEPYGYGRGVNADYYNYIDFDRKVFVQRVKEVDMGLLNWGYRLNNNRHIFNANLSAYGIQGQISPDIPINALAEDYRAVTVNATWVDRDMSYNYNAIGNQTIEIVDNRYTNQTDFKAAVSGKKLLFAVETPIEIDISAYLTDDNFIEVEDGGVIRAVNDYEQDAPSTIEYQTEVVE